MNKTFEKPSIEYYQAKKIQNTNDNYYQNSEKLSNIYSIYKNCINKNLQNGKKEFTCGYYFIMQCDSITKEEKNMIHRDLYSEYNMFGADIKLNYGEDTWSGF
jgi:hypothetical protein